MTRTTLTWYTLELGTLGENPRVNLLSLPYHTTEEDYTYMVQVGALDWGKCPPLIRGVPQVLYTGS